MQKKEQTDFFGLTRRNSPKRSGNKKKRISYQVKRVSSQDNLNLKKIVEHNGKSTFAPFQRRSTILFKKPSNENHEFNKFRELHEVKEESTKKKTGQVKDDDINQLYQREIFE